MYLCTCDVQHRDYASGLTKEHIIDSLKNFYDKNKIFEVFKLFYDEDLVRKIKSLRKEE